MMGLIIPGGWEEFFRFIGEPYDGPLWPMDDQRNVFDVLIPKLKMAAEQFDVVPMPQQKQFDPLPWEQKDSVLPGKMESYFLKSGSGPAWLSGGTVIRPLITTAESGGKLAIGSIEGCSQHASSEIFSRGLKVSFPETHHAFRIDEGTVEFSLGNAPPSVLHAGDVVYVPGNTVFCYQIRSRYAKMYAFASGKGIVELLIGVGEKYTSPIPPERAAKRVDELALRSVARGVGGEIL